VKAVVLALGASLSWGFADFFGPLQGRTLGALRSLVYVQLGGLLAIGLVVAVRAKGPADEAVLLAIPAAFSGTLGLYAYYRGMAVGAMSIVAPIAGISAIVPVVVGIASGDRPSTGQLTGIGAALAGVYFAAREPGGRGRLATGVGLALLAALGFGGYFPPMHAAGEADFWWTVLVFKITASVLVLAVVAIRRAPIGVPRLPLAVLALVGVGEMLGNLLFAAASASGLVSITSVLASLYPIVTILLARAILHERVSRGQEAGILLTLAGVVLISAS
jgi:drug/metabolite transporter (DMT)-like permease